MKAVKTAGPVLVLTLLLCVVLPALPAHAAVAPVVGVVVVDGDSLGELKPGNSSELEINLWNQGDEVATGVSGTLSSSEDVIEVTDPGPKPYGDIEVDNEVTQVPNAEPFVVAVAPGAVCGPSAFTLAVVTDQGTFDLALEIAIGGECQTDPAPLIVPGGRKMIDAETGEVLEDLTVGRAIRLEISLHNIGDLDSDPVTTTLSAPAGDADITDAHADYGPIGAHGEVTGSFGLTMNSCDPAGLFLHLAIEGAPAGDTGSVGATPPPPGSLEISLDTRCPGMHLLFTGATYDDAEGGNGDGLPQPGEMINVFIRIENDGANVLSGLVGTFSAEHADVLQATATYPEIAPTEQATNVEPFVVRIHDDAPTFTVGAGPGCSSYIWGNYLLQQEGVVSSFKQTIQVDSPDGQSQSATSHYATVCVLAAVPNTGAPLPETGARPIPMAGAGAALIALGLVMRRRARRL